MKRVLVVDDDPAMVQTLQDVLRLHGWDADAAHSGAEAVAAVAKQPYTAVLMDVRMPGTDGVAAYHQIRREQHGVPVVLMTAFATDQVIAEARRAGVLTIVPKPLDLRNILRLLEHVAPKH